MGNSLLLYKLKHHQLSKHSQSAQGKVEVEAVAVHNPSFYILKHFHHYLFKSSKSRYSSLMS